MANGQASAAGSSLRSAFSSFFASTQTTSRPRDPLMIVPSGPPGKVLYYVLYHSYLLSALAVMSSRTVRFAQA